MPKRYLNFPFAACAVQISSASDEIQLMPAGPFRGVDGRPSDVEAWELNPVTAAVWLAELRLRKTYLVIDYEHQTLLSADNGKPAPAAGWFTGAGLEIRNGELWATDVRWTGAAKAAIEAEEYLYISPVFTYDLKTGEVTGLINAALTNSPAIDGMEQVLRAAASQFAQQQEHDVDPKELRKALGLPEDATDEQVLAACKQRTAKVAELEGQNTELETQLAAATQQTAAAGEPDPARYVPIAAFNEMRDSVAALSQQITGDKVESLVTAALNDGRLLPSQKDWATSLGKKDLAALTAYLESASPIAGLRQGQTDGDPNATAAAKGAHGLTPGQLAICKQLGQSPEDYKKQLDELEGETA